MDECLAFFDAWTTARDYLAVFGSLASTRLRNDAALAARDLVDLRAVPAPAGSSLAATLAVAERQLARLTRARRRRAPARAPDPCSPSPSASSRA